MYPEQHHSGSMESSSLACHRRPTRPNATVAVGTAIVIIIVIIVAPQPPEAFSPLWDSSCCQILPANMPPMMGCHSHRGWGTRWLLPTLTRLAAHSSWLYLFIHFASGEKGRDRREAAEYHFFHGFTAGAASVIVGLKNKWCHCCFQLWLWLVAGLHF
jgi:hypothetical protein